MQRMLNNNSAKFTALFRNFLLTILIGFSSFASGQVLTPTTPTNPTGTPTGTTSPTTGAPTGITSPTTPTNPTNPTTSVLTYMPITGVVGTTIYNSVPTGGTTGLSQFSSPGLPAGFSISPTTGAISGSSTVVINNITPISVTAKDATNNTVTGGIMINISSGNSSPTTGTPTGTTSPTTGAPTGTTSPTIGTPTGTTSPTTPTIPVQTLFYYGYLDPVLIGNTISHQVITTSLPTTTSSFALTNESKNTLNNIGGVTFDETTGTISGKPNNLGSFSLQINALSSDAKVVANAYTFISVTLPTFGYSTLGNIIIGDSYTSKPVKAPATIASFILETEAQKTFSSIGGLELNSKDGTISGKPVNLGMYNFQVMGLDASGQKVAQSYNYIAVSLPSFDYTTSSNTGLGLALIGSSYTAKVLMPFTGVISYAIDASSMTSFSSMEGFTLDSKTGTIAGLGLKEGNYNFTVNGLDAAGNVIAKSQQFLTIKFPWFNYNMNGALVIDSTFELTISNPPTKAKTYSLDASTLAVFNSIGTLNFNTTSGVISGVPKKLGNYMFIVNTYDDYAKLIAISNVVLQVSLPGFSYEQPNLVIVNTPIKLNILNKPTNAKTFVIDQTALANFQKIGGMSFNTATGVISGTPEKIGSVGLTVYAKDENEKNIGISYPFVNVSLPIFSYTVNDPGAETIVVDSNFISTIKIAPEKAVRYTVDSMFSGIFSTIGGLEFDGKTGVISGNPKNKGNYFFKINAYDNNSKAIATANIRLNITYPQFKYKPGYENGVVDAEYTAQVLNPIQGTVTYTTDDVYLKNLTAAGLQFNKNDGSISGKPKRNGYLYLAITASDVNNKPIGSSTIQIFIKKASTISIVSGTTTYNYNNKPQGPSEVTKTGSSGSVSFVYKGIDNEYNSNKLPTNAGEYTAIATIAEDSTYFYASSTTVKFKIQKTPLIITATEQLKKFGSIITNGNPTNYGLVGSSVNDWNADISNNWVPSNNFDIIFRTSDKPNVLVAYVNFTKDTALPTSEWKIRKNNNWDINWGGNGDGSSLVRNSDNITTPEGKCKVEIDTVKLTYKVSSIQDVFYKVEGGIDGQAITGVTVLADNIAQDPKAPSGTKFTITPSAAIGVGGFLPNNYDIKYVPYVGTIGKRNLTISATGPNKLFGSALTSEVSTKNFTATGMLDGELVTSVTLTPDANGLSSASLAGSKYKIIPSLAKGSGGFVESNYDVTYVPFVGEITKRELIITATGPVKTYGTALIAGNNISDISVKGLGSGETITEIILTPDANGQSSTLTVGEQYTITPSAAKGTLGDLAANYNITYVPFVGTVTKKPLTITAKGVNKPYGTSVSAGTTNTNFLTTNLSGAESITEVTLTPDNLATSTTTPAGTLYTVTPSQVKGSGGFVESNYEITYLPFIGRVVKSNVSIRVTGNTIYTYTGSPVGPTTTNLGSTDIIFIYSGIAPTIYTSNTAPIQAGSYQVIAKQNTTDNVNETISNAFSFKIEKGTTSISVTGSQTYTYNGKLQGPATSTVVGSTENVIYTYSGVSPTVYTASTIAPKNAGTYQVVASVDADNNFEAASSSAYTFTITKANLQVTADNKAKTLNLPLPLLTKFYTGFTQGDDSTSLTTQPVITTTAKATSPIGDYPITVSGGSSANYNLSYQAGTLTIDLKIDPTISLTDINTSPSGVVVNGNVIKSNTINSFNIVKRNAYASNKVYGDAPFTLSASSNSNGSFTFRSHNTNVLTISGNVVTIVGAGTALIEVIQGAGNAASGTDAFHEGNASATVVVSKANSTVIVTGNTSYTYSSNAQGPATTNIVGSNGQVTYNYIGTGITSYASSNKPSAIGTYNVTATVASNENYNGAVSQPFNFEIAKANSTISVTGLSSFVYNGLAQGANNAIISGSNSSVTYSYVGTGNNVYGPSNIQPINAGTYQVTATVAENDNYKSAISDPFAFTILKDNSTIFAVGNKNYTYKGTPQGPNSTTGITGSTGSITFNYIGSGSTTYGPSTIAPSNAGNYQSIATVASDLNYNAASSPAFEFTIVKASVDLKVTGSTSYTFIASGQGPNSSNLSGSSTAITFTYYGTNGTNYGPSETRPSGVGTYGVIASSIEDANQFGATSDVFEFTIIKEASSISVVGNSSYVYNETAQGPSDKLVVGSTGLVSYSYTGTGNTNYATTATAPTLVGSYQVIATVVSDENYNGAVSTPFAYTITKANSSISVIGTNVFVYNGYAQGPNDNSHTGSTSTITYNYKGIGSTVYVSSTTAPTNVGIYQVIASLPADDNNFSAVSLPFEFTITKANPSLSINGLTVFEYSGKPQGPNDALVVGSTGILTYIYTGRGSTVYASSKVAPTNVGNYQVTATVSADQNFNAISTEAFNFSIIKKLLTVTALDVSKTVNTPNPTEFYLEYTGFVPGENENNLSQLPIGSTDANTSSSVGDYTVSVSGGVSNNYEFNYISGTLTIDTRLTPEIAMSDISKKYGDVNFTINATSNSQGLFTYRSSNTNVATISGNNVTIVGAGSASIIINQSADVPNNFLPTTIKANLVVDKVPLTITASDKTKVYGTENPAATVSYIGFVNGDDITAISTTPTLSYSATNASSVGTYTITASDAIADNYSITYVNGILSVTKAPLTITAIEVSKSYGSSLSVLNNSNKFTATALISGESISSVTLTPDSYATSATTPAGATYQIIPSNASGTSGFNAANYEITYVSYEGVVTKKALTITATGPNKVYGTSISTNTNGSQFTSDGLLDGETITGVTLTPNSLGASASTAAGITYLVTASLPIGDNGFEASNYNISYVPFEGVVAKKSLIITADNKTKVYGSANPAFTISYYGFVSNEDASALTLAPIASSNATVTSNAGSYDISISAVTADNYTITVNKGTLIINKAVLVVSTENKSRTYGATNPQFTITYAGFVNDQNETILATAPIVSTSASNISNVGDYNITISGAADNNYDFVYNNGVLTINKATLTVTAQDNARCFAAKDPALSYIAVGFVYNEDTTALTAQIKMKTNTDATTTAGEYKTIAYGAAATNYDIVYVDGKFTVQPPPKGSITSSVDYLCDGAMQVLSATGGASYIWYKDGTAITGATDKDITITSKGNYNAKLISAIGCEAMSTNTLAIKQYYAPVADFTSLYSCLNVPVLITNKSTVSTSGTVKYAWEDGAGGTNTIASPSFTYASTGAKTIKLTVMPDYCPALKQSVSKVVTIESPVAPVRLPVVDVITFTPTPLQARTFGTTYDWKTITSGIATLSSSKVSNPMLTTNAETIFNIAISTTNGCVTVDTLQARVFSERTVYLPNAFTPNGDGVNDIFKINPVGVSSLNYFRIFNQWGQIVFETRNLSEGWDGKLNGVRLPLATYNWIIEATDNIGNAIRESGSVTLIR